MGAVATGLDLATIRVLIVDDQEHARRFNATVLERMGITRIMSVDSGHAAIQEVTKPGAEFDLILCDLQMPRTDGIETIRALGALGVRASFVITSVEEERVIESAALLAAGEGLTLLGRISKPLSDEKMRPVLAALDDLHHGTPAPTVVVTAAELDAALTHNELYLVYQPKVAMRTGLFVGAEAMLRWKHPVHGILQPDVFLPTVSDSSAVLGKVVRMMLDEALTFIAGWRADGHDNTVSVNLPARAFEILELPEIIEERTVANKTEPKALTIEVSEAELVADTIRTRDVATRLRLKRFGLALDQFGLGSSDLHRLHQMPFTELKLAPGVIQGFTTSTAKRSLVDGSLALTRSLGVTCVADGVSSREEWDTLAAIGCDQAQGNFLVRPMPEHGLEAWAGQWMLQQR
jgi:EAL domain-containing protein (putative c-di-GMP-specific phosphodiesterase class I)/FixJ family two-component response regulator